MGMFMASVAFSCADAEKWSDLSSEIQEMVSNSDGLYCNLNAASRVGCIISPYGDGAPILVNLPERISALAGGYAIFANCVDSDFNMISLWNNGEFIEDSYIGRIYQEYLDFCSVSKPDVNLWLPLLCDKSKTDELKHALLSDQVFAEDNLIELSMLTGLPVFDAEFLEKCC